MSKDNPTQASPSRDDRCVLHEGDEWYTVSTSRSTKVLFCDSCENLHMFCHGPDGTPEYEAVLDEAMVHRFGEMFAERRAKRSTN